MALLNSTPAWPPLYPVHEVDPNGLDAHAPGAKLDAGKLIAGEIVTGFPRAMEALITVATYGAAKYSRGGYLQVSNHQVRYLDAAMRHLLRYGAGESVDPESKLHHLHHCLWNIAAVVELRARDEEAASNESVRPEVRIADSSPSGA